MSHFYLLIESKRVYSYLTLNKMYEVSDFDLMKAPINTKVAIHKHVKNL